MKYKKSQYNTVIEHMDDGKILIYNTFSGILGIMDIKTQDYYNNIENINVNQISDSEIKNNIDILINSGYIVDSEKDELLNIKDEREQVRNSHNILSLTIAPTLSCNMCCPYCYESKNKKRMSKETLDQLINFVKIHIAKFPEINTLSIFWYGGEPLLEKESIYFLSENFIKLCNDRNITYKATIVTNGSLLDKETAYKLFYECKVENTQITIDGMPQKHNRRRIFVDGSGSFDIIINNIDNCKDFMPISIRMNIDKNNTTDIKEFFDFVHNEKHWENNPSIYIAPVDDYNENNCSKKLSSCFQSQEFASIDNQFRRIRYSLNPQLVEKELFPRHKTVSCGAECRNNYVIDPEGYFYNCWLVIGKEEFRGGHIRDPFKNNSNYLKWILSDIPEKCETCNYLPMCLGGCAYFRVIKKGDPKCANAYYNYKERLKLAYENYMSQKN